MKHHMDDTERHRLFTELALFSAAKSEEQLIALRKELDSMFAEEDRRAQKKEPK